MATAQRVFYETVTVLLFLVLLVAAWLLSGARAERRLAAARAEQRQQLEALSAERSSALDRLAEEKLEAAAAFRRAEAEAVFRGFAAGVQPAVVDRWRRFLGATRDELMRTDPRVTFLHLATPDGYILTSTDAELTARGRLDDGGEWMLAAKGLVTRSGEGGALELAGPIRQGERTVAYLWLGYDVGAAPPSP